MHTNLRNEVRSVAEKVVSLLEQGRIASSEEAKSLIAHHYSGDPIMVSRSYELACLVALKNLDKRILNRRKIQPIAPHADIAAMRAAYLISTGRLQESFTLLKQAVQEGATTPLCRRVAQRLINRLPVQNRQSILGYIGKSIITVEVGRVPNAGYVLVGETSKRVVNQLAGEIRTKPKSQIILRSSADYWVDADSSTSGSFNWLEYYLALENMQDSLDLR